MCLSYTPKSDPSVKVIVRCSTAQNTSPSGLIGNWLRKFIRPERFMCISTNPSPSLYRSWETGIELTDNDVEEVISKVGFESNSDTLCKRPSNAISAAICSSRRTDREFDYLLIVTSPDPGEPPLITLIESLTTC